jgi:HORMA domain-containing protein
MSMSYTTNDTFSIIHARRIASRVAADLLRFQSFYGLPSDKSIDDYEEELAVLLNHDVLAWVEYGFQRSGKWTEAAVRYTALPGGTLIASDDPGKIRPNLDVAGAQFTSFLD